MTEFVSPPNGGPVADGLAEAMTAAVWYGRAYARAERFWPPWTLRQRRERSRLCGHHADVAFERLLTLVSAGEEHQETPGSPRGRTEAG